ncbi:TOBE domain-containing protein [Candidatus Burkholderia verschuerenii]|uniref:TOBE domain-containing protein n=1 Tax=Candidatus Burkholderia verschuerenii TaxID=242163 RepID=UPI000A5A3F91|nr:TOBE domain-containing protein [Candidatus Burkholderia verschuerenii]
MFLGEILRIDLSLPNGASLQMRRMDCAHLPVPAVGSDVFVRWAESDCWVIE